MWTKPNWYWPRRIRLHGLLCLLALSPFLLLDESVLAATYYVSKSTANGWSIGNDNNACTTTNVPCLTIAGGLGKMSSGDTLLINDGTYVEWLNDVVPSGGGTEATRTIVKCFRVRACTLDAAYLAWSFVNSDTNWITIQDMVICCGDTTLVRLGTTSPLPTTDFPHHMRFKNNEIHSSTIYPVYTGHGDQNEWLDNTIHDCGEQCVYLLETNSIWRGNELYRVLNGHQFVTMHVSGGMGSANVLMENNYIHDCISGPEQKSAAIEIADTGGHVIRRNVITGCSLAGIRANTGKATNVTIDHNSIYNTGWGIFISNTGSTGNLVRNNAVIGNTTNISICSGCGTSTTNLTTGTPTAVWTDPASRNFTLKTGSPAIDACTPIGLPYTGSAPDCGAFESAGGGSVDTTPPLPPSGLVVQQ